MLYYLIAVEDLTMNTYYTDNNIYIYKLPEKLDNSMASQIKTDLIDNMSSHDNIVIDMSNCQFISNYGLYFLSSIINKAKFYNNKLIFTCALQKISDILYLTGFMDSIEIAPSVKDALKNLN